MSGDNKSNLGIILAAVAALFVLFFIIVPVTSYFSAANYGAITEARLQAQQDDNRNILAQYGQKVQEAAQVPDMYTDKLKEVATAALSGRYGPNGSQAIFQMIKEQNPQVDPAVYTKLQSIIEGSRDNFERGQRRLLDIKMQYSASLNYPWRGLWLHVAGYPKVNLADIQIVSTGRADDAFAKHREDAPIKLRQ